MKILTQCSTAALFALSAGCAAFSFAAEKTDRTVNAYGEPAGFNNPADVVLLDTPELNRSQSRPGTVGLYVIPGTFDRRNFESLGSWQARKAAEAKQGTVTIGALEVMDSGPTGPMSPDAIVASRDEVTTQVLSRIKTTDHAMFSLKQHAKTLDDDAQGRFKMAAAEVAERRVALRENLKALRTAESDQWSEARSNVAVSYNAYVQAQHHAEEVVGVNQSS